MAKAGNLKLDYMAKSIGIKLYFRISPARCGPGQSRKNAALEAIFLIETAADAPLKLSVLRELIGCKKKIISGCVQN